MLFKRRELQPPPLEKIMSERRYKNLRVWERFKSQGLVEAWEFVVGERCECPPLVLEPNVFRERLGMRSSQHEIMTDLELAVRRKLAGEPDPTPWTGK